MSIVILTPPAAEPLLLPEVYDHLRLGIGLTSHPDDSRLLRLIKSAREKTETHTRRALITQTVRYVLDEKENWSWTNHGYGWRYRELRGSFWGGFNTWWHQPTPIELLHPPVQSVTAVQYYDPANNLQSIDVANYRVNLDAFVPRIEFIDGFVSPQIAERTDAVSCTYVCGYPAGPGVLADGVTLDPAGSIPQTIKEAMLLMIDRAYNARLPAEEVMLDAAIDSMLANYRVERF